MTSFRPLLALPFALLSLPAHATTTGVEPGDVEIHIVSPVDGAEVSSPVDVIVVEGTGQIWDAEVLVDGVPAAQCDLWDLGGDACTMSIPMLLGEHTITVRGDIEGELIDDDSITVTVVAISDTDGTGGSDSGSGESHGEASDDAGTAEGGSEATESADDGDPCDASDDGMTSAGDDAATTAMADEGGTSGAGDDGSTTAGGGGAGDDGGGSRGCSIGDAGRPLPLLGLLVLGLARRRRRSSGQRRR
jgi:MYXO-CTERM domain-containing protein